jgi:plastocyanin
MRPTLPAAVLAAAALLGFTACGSESSEESSPGGASIKTIEIAESDFKLDPSKVTIDEPGVYTFHAVNKGATDHALEIEGEGTESETDTIAPGQSADVKVELKKGTYELYCPVDGHRDMGMEGSIAVGGATMSGGDDGGTTTDGDSGGYSY